MLKRIAGLSTFLSVALAVPASAQQPSNSSPDNIVVTGQQYDKKDVCRFEQNTGTRFLTRICHTNKQWDQMREQQQRSTREMIDQVIGPVANSKRD
jgi:hypothetical protein